MAAVKFLLATVPVTFKKGDRCNLKIQFAKAIIKKPFLYCKNEYINGQVQYVLYS